MKNDVSHSPELPARMNDPSGSTAIWLKLGAVESGISTSPSWPKLVTGWPVCVTSQSWIPPRYVPVPARITLPSGRTAKTSGTA